MIRYLALALVAAVLPTPASAATLTVEFIAASTADLENPHDLKLSPDGKYLFVSDVGNNRVAVLDPDTLEQTPVGIRATIFYQLVFQIRFLRQNLRSNKPLFPWSCRGWKAFKTKVKRG